jgi:3-keto-disaccharide hydrolase
VIVVGRDAPIETGRDATREGTNVGYEDTPIIPGSRFRVHDGSRPQPGSVRPGTASTPETPGDPPSDAVLLFDGTTLMTWVSVNGGEAAWNIEHGYMEVVPGTGDIQTRVHFGNCQLHLEWATPATVTGEGQGRGNSGVWLMSRYEIQILDGYENPTYADGTTAAIYGQYPPLVNACRAPGAWQCYDIIWIAPRFHGDQLVSPAYATVLHNGLVVHHHTPLFGPTQHRQVAPYRPHSSTGPLRLQDHGNAVRYRNIWYRPLKAYDEP